MRWILILVAALAACACTREPFRGNARPWADRRAVAAPDTTPAHRSEGDTVAYMVAVEFPEGCDWRRSAGAQACTLSVFSGQRRVLSIPVDGGGGISVDADRNHLVGGHLYSDWFEGGSTVVARDGVEIFRFDGCEFFRGMVLAEDGLWTIGERTSGDGFTLRCNGKDMFARSSGEVVGGFDHTVADATGALRTTDAIPEFSYTSRDGVLYRVQDCEAEPIALSEDVGRVYDALEFGGEYWCAARREGGSIGLYRDGFRALAFDTTAADAVYGAVLVPGAGSVFLKVRFDLGDLGPRQYIWESTGRICYVSKSLSGTYMDGNEVVVFIDDVSSAVSPLAAYEFFHAAGDRLMDPSCAVCKDGHVWAAVTPADDLMYPYLMRDGLRFAIPINGYLASLEVVP